MDTVIGVVPASLTDLVALGGTLKKSATHLLAFFDLPGASNGPTAAINGITEIHRRVARGYHNRGRIRILLAAGGLIS